ncbi:hypothetical protein FHS85_001286 [Rhodoligotrophos appendicifer]
MRGSVVAIYVLLDQRILCETTSIRPSISPTPRNVSDQRFYIRRA